MQGGGAGEAQTRGDQTPLRLARHGLERPRHGAQQGLAGLVRARVHHHLGPAGVIGDHAAQLTHAAILHIDEDRALGAAFPDAAPLQIAGIDDVRMLVQHFELMHMAQSPIVVATRHEVLRGAGRIGGMARLAVAGRVQHADVEEACDGRGIGRGPVLGLLAFQKAAAMDGDAQRLDLVRPGALHREGRHIVGQGNRAGDDIFRVMVAVDDEDRDRLAMQSRQFAGEEEADRRVLPLAVIDVACDQHEGDALGDGGGDQIGKGGAASLREAPGDGLVLQGEAQQRAAQMQIGAMQKGEIHGLAQVNKTGTSSGSRPRARGNRHGSRFPTRRRIALSVLCL